VVTLIACILSSNRQQSFLFRRQKYEFITLSYSPYFRVANLIPVVSVIYQELSSSWDGRLWPQ